MTKHLALLASLGRLGLSEHMMLCGGGSAAAQDRAGARFSERLVPLSDTTLYGFTGLDGGLGAVVATRRDGQRKEPSTPWRQELMCCSRKRAVHLTTRGGSHSQTAQKGAAAE